MTTVSVKGMPEHEFRVVAADKQGCEQTPATWDSTVVNGVTQLTPSFRNLPLQQIKEFRLQARPYQHVEFRNVALQPGGPPALADSPFELKKFSTAEVIEAGVSKPLSPWAWQELESRKLTADEAGQILDALTAWLQRDYPDGYTQPLSWLDRFLDELAKRGLVSNDRAIRFLQAFYGNLRAEASASAARRPNDGAIAVGVAEHLGPRIVWHEAAQRTAFRNPGRSAGNPSVRDRQELGLERVHG